MARSETSSRALFARDGGGQVFLDLIRISHPSWSAGPMRFVNNTSNIVSRGATYEAAPFEIPIPAQVEAGSPNLTIVLQNADRLIEAELAALVSEPIIVYECVMVSAPDNVVFTYRLPLRSSITTRNTIAGTLGGVEPILSRNFPRARFNSTDFPGLADEGGGTPGSGGSGGSGTPSISVIPTTLTSGTIITVTVANGPGNTTDSVGLYTSDQQLFINKKYLNGSSTTPPATALTDAIVTFVMPTPQNPPGSYRFYFLANDSLANILAISALVTVTS